MRARRAGAPCRVVGAVPRARAEGDEEATARPVHEVLRPEGARRFVFG